MKNPFGCPMPRPEHYVSFAELLGRHSSFKYPRMEFRGGPDLVQSHKEIKKMQEAQLKKLREARALIQSVYRHKETDEEQTRTLAVISSQLKSFINNELAPAKLPEPDYEE